MHLSSFIVDIAASVQARRPYSKCLYCTPEMSVSRRVKIHYIPVYGNNDPFLARVHCIESVCISESPLWEVQLYRTGWDYIMIVRSCRSPWDFLRTTVGHQKRIIGAVVQESLGFSEDYTVWDYRTG